jgi:uncharacterized protein YjdB
MSLLPLSVVGQELVWSNTFDTPADVDGWTFSDGNANGNQWVQGQNILYNGTSLAYGSAGVLRHSINLVPTGNATNFSTENDWVISPEIDLTGSSGTITLAAYIGRQRTTHTSVSRNVWIYVSTPEKPVPTVEDFQALISLDQFGGPLPSSYGSISGGSNPWPSDLTQFIESLVDISSVAGKRIYIGFRSDRRQDAQNINIDELAIYAEKNTVNVPVTSVSLNKTTLSLVAGTSETLTASVAPADATNAEVTWSSSNEAVATVDATGKVTAVTAGTATITVTTTDGSKTAQCAATATAANPYSWLKAAAIAVEGTIAKVVGPDADKFTKFFINDQPVELSTGQVDLAGKTGELSLKATTADASGVIRLKISK